MVEEHPESKPAKTVRDQVADAVDIATIPGALLASGYVLYAKTDDQLYNNLKSLEKMPKLEALKQTYKTTQYGTNTAKELGTLHSKLTTAYTETLKENGFGHGFTGAFKRFGGLHANQKLEVLIQSITAGGIILGFSALLDQLKLSRKTESDKSLSI